MQTASTAYHLAMGDSRYLTSDLLLDASPLIYLAKLHALDVLAVTATTVHVTPAVLEEMTRPQVAYRHPDAVEIERVVAKGQMAVVMPTASEQEAAMDLERRIPGLGSGKTEVLSIAISRSFTAVIFERRARRVAASLGVKLIDIVELLVAGTPDPTMREERIVRFASLVNMRLEDVVALLARLRSGRLNRTAGRNDE